MIDMFKKHPSLQDTIRLVTKAHEGQKYGSEPYTYHLNRVATRASLELEDPMMMHAALMHDLLEDTNTTSRRIRKLGYSRKISYAVDLLTKPTLKPWEERRVDRPKPNWYLSYAAYEVALKYQQEWEDKFYFDYIDNLIDLAGDDDILRIKLADLCENYCHTQIRVESLEHAKKDLQKENSDLSSNDEACLKVGRARRDRYKLAIIMLEGEVKAPLFKCPISFATVM